MSSKKRNRSNKKSSSSSLSRKRRRKNAIDPDLTIAMIATIAVSLFDAINPTIATSSGRRDHKLDNGKNFRDYKIDPKDFLRNPWKYGLKILEELAELGGKTRKYKGRVNNRVFRCKTKNHSDYKDGMIVYAIFVQENVARTLVDRITWVCDYGMAILRDYDCRIIARKHSKNDKTAYAWVSIPIDEEMKLVQVHALLFNKVLFNKENRRGIFRETDHIDNSDEASNGLNNLLVNVRDGAPDGTTRLNNSNRSTQKNNTSGHKGVCDYKGSNEGGSKDKYGDFGFWQVKYNEFDKVSKRTKRKSDSKLFRRIKNGEAHKQKTFEEACKFQEEKTRKYVDDLEEYYKPIRALHDLWFSADRDSDDDSDDENENDDTQDVVRSFERHWQSLRPSILELTRSSK